MFRIDNKSIKRLESDLKAFAHKALPFATRNTLNMAAFDGQKESRSTISRDMVERNKFTKQSIRVVQAKTLNIKRQESIVGSTAGYMEDQEFGATKLSKGRHGVSIPTAYSAGQDGQKPRTKLPRRPNRLGVLKLRRAGLKGRKAKNRKQAILFKVQDAVTTGKRHVFLDLGKTEGIFRVVGGRKAFKRGWPKGAKLKMVHDMTRKSVTIKPRPWLKPSVDRTAERIPGFYRESLVFQLKRQRLFRTRGR